MHKVHIPLPHAPYDILIGDDYIANAGQYIHKATNAQKFFIITDNHIAPLYLDRLQASLKNFYHSEAEYYITNAGESAKSMHNFANICDDFLMKKIDRKSCIIALGGGVVGDLSGYVAASIMRGIDFIQIPTSLLAQVDSSVGGKTGINTKAGKNLIGAFHQPKLVLSDVSILESLPPREMIAGYGEIIKHGLLADAYFVDWCMANESKNAKLLLNGDKDKLSYAIAHSCRTKANIVLGDEKEQGKRALLNLGHTFAHAYETLLGYDGRLLHGEAVLHGLIDSFALSQHLNFCHDDVVGRLTNHFSECGINVSMRVFRDASITAQNLLDAMSVDKKTSNGIKTFILASKAGDAFIRNGVADHDILPVLEKALKR